MHESQVPLDGKRILIVESEIAFVPRLQDALEEQGAETLAVTDPYSATGAKRISSFEFCAAVVNSAHRRVAKGLKVPVLFYGAHADVPARPDAVVKALRAMLSDRL